MRERFNRQSWKDCVSERVPRVRIPFSPPSTASSSVVRESGARNTITLFMNKFCFYIKNTTGLYKLFKFQLTENGLYKISNSKHGDHISYHSDGTCLYTQLGKKQIKKIRKPLNDFSGIESLSCVSILMADYTNEKFPSTKIKKDDIIIESEPPVCIETILSTEEINLPSLKERLESKIFFKKIGHLYITFEVFRNSSNFIADTRYNPNTWEIGKNFFTWMNNKWQ